MKYAKWYDVFFLIEDGEFVFDDIEIFPKDLIAETENGDIFEDKTVGVPCVGVTVKERTRELAIERATLIVTAKAKSKADKLIRARLGQ